MPLPNRIYDYLKWFALVVLPAVSVFMVGIGDLFAWSQVDKYVRVSQLLAVFLGSILQVSSQYYHDDDQPKGSAQVIKHS